MRRQDRRLIDRFIENDRTAIEEVMVLIRRALKKFRLNNLQEENDIIQEALVKLTSLFRNQASIQKYKELAPLIFTLTQNTGLDYLRRQARPKKHLGMIDEYNEGGLAEPILQRTWFAGKKKSRAIKRAERGFEEKLEISLDYITLIFRIKREQDADSAIYGVGYRGLYKARSSLSNAWNSILASSRKLSIRNEKWAEIFLPMYIEMQAAVKKLTEEIRSLGRSGGQDWIEWPMDFNEFIDDLPRIRLSPATIIFRVWKKIFKKGEKGTYTDYDAMRAYYNEFKERFRGTDKEFLFNADFNPKALRIEAYLKSKMKPYYDRLAAYIYKKSCFDERYVAEELAEENKLIPGEIVLDLLTGKEVSVSIDASGKKLLRPSSKKNGRSSAAV